MRWGYARVSTLEQSPAGQVQALCDAGVPECRIVVEKASGMAPRPLLVSLVQERLREGDELVVAALDRLGRNARDLHELVGILRDMGVRLRSLREGLESIEGPMGDFLVGVLIAISQWEREVTRQRAKEGIQRARARGVHLGRKPKLSRVEAKMASVWRDQGRRLVDIAEALGCSTDTARRAIKRERGEIL